MHVAEQVSVNRRASLVVAMLAERPTTWMLPFLTLAASTTPETARHRLRVGSPTYDGTRTTLPFVWTIHCITTRPFDRLRGDLEVRQLDGVTTLGVVAVVDGANVETPGASVRLPERTVRRFLGHLRLAIEALVVDPTP